MRELKSEAAAARPLTRIGEGRPVPRERIELEFSPHEALVLTADT